MKMYDSDKSYKGYLKEFLKEGSYVLPKDDKLFDELKSMTWLDEFQSKPRNRKMVTYRELMDKPDFAKLFDELQDNASNKAGLLFIMKRTHEAKDGPEYTIHQMAKRMLKRLAAKDDEVPF